MAWLQVVCVAAVCVLAAGSPMTKGYSYPVPDNGLYLPPPPDKGGPVNPGGSDNIEVGISLPPAPTTRRPTTTRAPYRRPSTTRRPRPTPPKPEYIPPNLVPDGSDPNGGRVPFPTTRRPTTRRPITRRPTTRRPTTRRPTTRRPITRRPSTRRPVVTRPPVTRPVVTRPAPTPQPPAPGSKMMHMSRPYEFGYNVNDDDTANAFSQKETSDGMIITGEYRWDMPDGRTQIVTYLADWAAGYYPKVTYVPTDSL